jgi:2-methylcitrate dehydratase PrpD
VPGTASERPFVGQALGEFVAESTWSSISPVLRHEAGRSLLNYFGCALGSAQDPAVGTAVRLMLPSAGDGRVTVIGRRERLDPMGAAFANAISANLLDYDDTHWQTAIHPTAPVAAALFALAEQRGLSGAEALHALIMGVEVECRIGNAVSPQHYARGMHITATCGVFGAAAASAKLLKLGAAEVWTALGIAANQSAGVIENLTTGAKNVAVGNAARNGLLAALLAQAGYTAAPAAIEGPFGWARAVGDRVDLKKITGGLGERWEFQAIAYKPYPCGFVLHAIVDACHQLRAERRFASSDILRVVVGGNQLLLDRGSRDVLSGRDARVSIAHAAAVGLLRDKATAREFSSAAAADPELVALRGKVQAVLAPDMPTGAASVALTTRDGRTDTVLVRHARGSLESPLSDSDLEAKFRHSAGHSDRSDSELIGHIWSLDTAGTLTPLLSLMGEQ